MISSFAKVSTYGWRRIAWHRSSKKWLFWGTGNTILAVVGKKAQPCQHRSYQLPLWGHECQRIWPFLASLSFLYLCLTRQLHLLSIYFAPGKKLLHGTVTSNSDLVWLLWFQCQHLSLLTSSLVHDWQDWQAIEFVLTFQHHSWCWAHAGSKPAFQVFSWLLSPMKDPVPRKSSRLTAVMTRYCLSKILASSSGRFLWWLVHSQDLRHQVCQDWRCAHTQD